jgi:hypothetical protein
MQMMDMTCWKVAFPESKFGHRYASRYCEISNSMTRFKRGGASLFPCSSVSYTELTIAGSNFGGGLRARAAADQFSSAIFVSLSPAICYGRKGKAKL